MKDGRTMSSSTARTATLLMGLALAAGAASCGRDERGPILAGGREVKSWIADLRNPRPQVRRQVVLKLGNVGDADPAAAGALTQALNDPDALVRRDAILAIAKLKSPTKATRERLETMSRSDKDPRARELAGKALIRLRNFE
jgi:HEAT repeat protein